MHSKKGQIEIEAIMAVAFSMVILLMVLVHTSNQRDEVTTLEIAEKEKNQCNLISSLISLMNSNSSEDSVNIYANFPVTITGNTVIVGTHHCTFSGFAQEIVLSNGNARIFEQNGVVSLENV